MSRSSQLTAGVGDVYEENVVLHYLTALLAEKEGYGIRGVVTNVSLQRAAFNQPLDDVIVDVEFNGKIACLSLQVKQKVVISAAPTNKAFRDIIVNAWKTLQGDNFRIGIDRVGFVVNEICDKKRRDFEYICGLTKNHNPQAFGEMFEKNSSICSIKHKEIKSTIEKLLKEVIGRHPTIEDVHKLLLHFSFIKHDFSDVGSTNETYVINVLSDLFLCEPNNVKNAILYIVNNDKGYSPSFNRDMLLNKLSNEHQIKVKVLESKNFEKIKSDGFAEHSLLMALPFGSEYEGRRAWPENLLMRIGVDRTRLLGVVEGVEAQTLFEALRYSENLVHESDKAKKFGRRQWFCVDSEWPQIDNDSTAKGYVWNIPDDVSVSDMKEAIYICWPRFIESANEQRVGAGNILIAVVKNKDNSAFAESIINILIEQTKNMGVTVSVCGWSVDQATQLAKAVSDSATGEVRIGRAYLAPFAREIVRNCCDSLNVEKREQALKELRELYSQLPNNYKTLCDWVFNSIDNAAFYAQANLEVYQLAGLAGLLTGDGFKLTSEQSERAVEIIRTINNRQDLSSMLGALPVCSSVLDELMSCKAKCRGVVGLVMADEVHRAVKPWIGYPMIDDWRNGRLLIF